LGPLQALRRNRRSTDPGIQPIELTRHVAQHFVDQSADRAQRMIHRHTLLDSADT
jgi:hypothetical protein